MWQQRGLRGFFFFANKNLHFQVDDWKYQCKASHQVSHDITRHLGSGFSRRIRNRLRRSVLLSRLYKNIWKNNVTYHLSQVSKNLRLYGNGTWRNRRILELWLEQHFGNFGPISLLARLLHEPKEGQKRTSKQAADRQQTGRNKQTCSRNEVQRVTSLCDISLSLLRHHQWNSIDTSLWKAWSGTSRN